MKCPYFTEEESGVSPVIGVMLMLVVTIIIAAVVSGFAGGLTDSSTDVPVAAFEFKAYSAFMIASSHGGAGPYLEAIMKSGEAIDTGDLKIVSYYEDADRNIISHEFTQSPEFQGAHGSKNTFRSFNGGATNTFFGRPGAYWHTGDKFCGGIEYVLGYPDDEVEPGDQIEIHVVHEPSNTVIWSDEVTVI
ncbi:type IV pilin N-terminal domain-containing protein [Methanogenium cariaci]|jgi:archaeal type IV pilus assembly protein PilA